MLENPNVLLQKYWGFSSFRGSQKKIIDAILRNQDVLALLPTGGGKSLCYQLPALAKEGICIVVSPLIALIQNQVANLNKKGIKAIALTGGIRHDELVDLLDNCLYGGYKFLYLSPERLQQEIVQTKIQQMNVNLIAIDEAHCISQWGHDFRPAYLRCGELRTLTPNVPILAVTATATRKVAADITTYLQLNPTIVIKDSFARSNIAFKVFWEEDKLYRLKTLCHNLKNGGIVYVRSRKACEELTRFLHRNNLSAAFYHGGISNAAKKERLQQWIDNDVQIMVATNAFGMGVDKPDVGLVIHYQIPDSLESYFQEAGRAGRDGSAAQAVLIINPKDEEQVKSQFLKVLPSVDFLKTLYKTLSNYFQISYGEGEQTAHQLHFNAFCDRYKLNHTLTYNGLRTLDQNSIIALSDSFAKKTTIQFIVSKEMLFQYMERYPKIVTIVQFLLRTYGGVFDFVTRINTLLIAKKCNRKETYVLEILEQLQRDEIINYSGQHNDIEVSFLVPREDDLAINVIAKKVSAQQRAKREQVASMLNYVHNTTNCRSKQLLAYFGEKLTNACEICDFCDTPRALNAEDTRTLKKKILALLLDEEQSSRVLIEKITASEMHILSTLQQLLGEGKICINTRNNYELIR